MTEYNGHLKPFMIDINRMHESGASLRAIAEAIYDMGARTAQNRCPELYPAGYSDCRRSKFRDVEALQGLIRHALRLKKKKARGNKMPVSIPAEGWAEAAFHD